MYVLDRVLDCDYMAVSAAVGISQHGSKSCGLTASGRAGYKHKSPRQHYKLLKKGGKLQLLNGRDFICQYSHNTAETAHSVKHIYTAAYTVRRLYGQVYIASRTEVLGLLGRQKVQKLRF